MKVCKGVASVSGSQTVMMRKEPCSKVVGRGFGIKAALHFVGC